LFVTQRSPLAIKGQTLRGNACFAYEERARVLARPELGLREKSNVRKDPWSARTPSTKLPMASKAIAYGTKVNRKKSTRGAPESPPVSSAARLNRRGCAGPPLRDPKRAGAGPAQP
jgi:hypothetical protein